MARTPLIVLGILSLLTVGGAVYKKCETNRAEDEKNKLVSTLKKEKQLQKQVSALEDKLADVRESGSTLDTTDISHDVNAIKSYVDRKNHMTHKATSRSNIRHSQVLIKGNDVAGRQQVFGTGLMITRNGYFVAPHDAVKGLKDGKISYKGKDYKIETVMTYNEGLALVKAAVPGKARAIPMRLYKGKIKDDMKTILYAYSGTNSKVKHTKTKGTIPDPLKPVPYRDKDEDEHDYPEGFPKIRDFRGGFFVTTSGSLFGLDLRQGQKDMTYTPVHKVVDLLNRFVKAYKPQK